MKARFKVGSLVTVADTCDNENYEAFRGKTLKVTHVSRSTSDHPGFDDCTGCALYDCKGINLSLYDYELDYAPMRAICVTYSDGNVIETSMAAGLTDDEMLAYFAVGKWFNVGDGPNDNMQQVVTAEILR